MEENDVWQKKITRYLFVCMMFLLTTSLQVKAADLSGWCGNGVTWELTGDVLKISGEGTMYSYTNDIPPWGERREFITSVVIGHGVKNIGEYAFNAHTKIKSIEIPDSVTSIGGHVFHVLKDNSRTHNNLSIQPAYL